MKPLMTRVPLAIALTSALAFSVGCTDNRDVDDRTGMETPAERDAQPMPSTGDAAPGTPADRDTTFGEAVEDRTTADRMGDGPDSDQPVDDTWITTKVKSSLLADSDVSGLDIEVETVNGVVTLSGQVDEQMQIDRATQIVRDIEGVTDVRTTALIVEAGGNADR
ncbi:MULTISPECIES: BON domain-containing protein [unclassified Luteimonas]